MVLMVGIELKYFGDQLKPTNEIVRKYIFCDYSFVAFSLFRCSNWHLHNAVHTKHKNNYSNTAHYRFLFRWC